MAAGREQGAEIWRMGGQELARERAGRWRQGAPGRKTCVICRARMSLGSVEVFPTASYDIIWFCASVVSHLVREPTRGQGAWSLGLAAGGTVGVTLASMGLESSW